MSRELAVACHGVGIGGSQGAFFWEPSWHGMMNSPGSLKCSGHKQVSLATLRLLCYRLLYPTLNYEEDRRSRFGANSEGKPNTSLARLKHKPVDRGPQRHLVPNRFFLPMELLK